MRRVPNGFDNGEVSTETQGPNVHLRLANLETVVLSFCAGSTLLAASSADDTWTKHTVDSVEWGPWQCALPGPVLEQQCLAVRRVQRWWRRVAPSRYARTTANSEPLPHDNPLSFLAVRDIGRLHAVSFAHTRALCELGFSPPLQYESDDAEGEEEEGGGGRFDRLERQERQQLSAPRRQGGQGLRAAGERTSLVAKAVGCAAQGRNSREVAKVVGCATLPGKQASL